MQQSSPNQQSSTIPLPVDLIDVRRANTAASPSSRHLMTRSKSATVTPIHRRRSGALSLIGRPIGPVVEAGEHTSARGANPHAVSTGFKVRAVTRPVRLPAGMTTVTDSGRFADFVRPVASTARTNTHHRVTPTSTATVLADTSVASSAHTPAGHSEWLAHLSLVGLSIGILLLIGTTIAV